MKNELLTIGPFTIYGFGLMIALGILAAYFVAEVRAKRQGLPYEHVFFLVQWCMVGGFLGAKLLYWATEWRSIVQAPEFLFQTLMNGFVVYGGVIGGIFCAWLYCRRQRIRLLPMLDLLAPSLALAQGFGRIGCFLAGCCYGKQTDSCLSVTFHRSEYAPNGVALIPTQLYSSLLDFLHFGFLLFLAGKKRPDGQVTAAYLILYSAGRFIIEFFRGDLERGRVGVLSTSQFIAIFTAAAGAALLCLTRREQMRPHKSRR
ncbi:MAG: prolipoprotein diacylglyceryl transferase [Eubacteriales bacterium]|nr:prolipoprotein diacylglyceryl transferase [Eubacteriales bacterium]